MSLFGKSRDSAFDLLGQARDRILSQSPRIPPPGTLARPGRVGVDGSPVPRFRGGPVASPVVERAIEELLDVDGDPLLVIDDELDVSAIAPEEAVVDEEPAKVLGVRTDTAVVFGIGLVLVVAIAYFAGRTAKPGEAARADAAPTSKAFLQPPAQAPPLAGSPLAALDTPAADDTAPPPKTPAAAKSQPATDDAAAPSSAPEPRSAAAGSFELCVVTTSEAKADKVVDFLNKDPSSPIAGKNSLEAYAKKGSRAQVRIRGFEKEDMDVRERVRAMKDPTGGGHFNTADFQATKR
jgi:hypothetical protein